MKKIMLLIFMLTLVLSGCNGQKQPTASEENKTMQNLTLYFNQESGKDFAARTQTASSNPLPTSSTTFYKLSWHQNPIELQVSHGRNTITLHHVIGVQAGVGNSDELITGYLISSGLSNENTINHDQARLNMLAILQQLKNKGWHRFIDISSPRLSGLDAMKYAQNNTYQLDPDYILSLDEWMQLDDGSGWEFQANGVFLTIKFYRDQSLMDPNIPGAYYVSYNFESEKKFYSALFRNEDLKKWKINAARWVELFPGIKKEMNRFRFKEEAILKAQGIKIDESYQDPPLVSKK